MEFTSSALKRSEEAAARAAEELGKCRVEAAQVKEKLVNEEANFEATKGKLGREVESLQVDFTVRRRLLLVEI
jgi:hypothetical protein